MIRRSQGARYGRATAFGAPGVTRDTQTTRMDGRGYAAVGV